MIKDKHANSMVESSMVEGITPSLTTTIVDLGIDVRVEETKPTMVE